MYNQEVEHAQSPASKGRLQLRAKTRTPGDSCLQLDSPHKLCLYKN